MSALELHPGSSSSTGTRSSPRTIPAKRAKAAQACTSCRKHKTRCEMLDGDSCGYQCHRCKVLNLPCSFETSGAPCSENDLPPATRARLSDDNSTSRHHPSPSFPKFAQDIAMDDSVSSSPWNTSNTEQQPLTTRPMPQYRSQSNDDMDLLHPEGLFPIQQRPWGFLKLPGGFDGTTVPMLAMQALTRAVPNEEPLKNKVEISLLHILGKDKVKHLLDIFEERYSPWLNLQPSQRTEGPLLRLAQCCVASRHLDLPIKTIVAPQLYRLAEEVVFKQIFSPLPSTDSIHAMLILSMWEPVDDPTHRETKDGRLMASSAVSMAMNLRLSEAMVYAKTLREQTKDPSDTSAAELAEAVDKARLWFSLTNSESMLCIGTRRDPMSRCKDLIHDAIDSSSLSTIGAGRDLRLSLLSQIFATTEHGLSIRLLSIGDLGKFYKEILDTLMKMDNLERLASPLSVLAEHEVFYFHMLQVIYQWCRLLFLVHALMETKNIISKHHHEIPWFLLAEHNGINLARSWGQQALVLSEGILITSLSRPELALLSSAPDNFFSMITLATFFVVLSKWSMLQNTGEQLPGSSDSILAKTIERLSQVACSPDHAPARCAQLINACVLSFRRRASEKTESEPLERSALILEHFNTAARNFTERVASTSSPSPFVTGEGMSQVFPSSFPINDPNYFMNSDIFLDNNFWASFMANLSEGSSG
ncbi:hypothetical protein SERLA73DRAFT_178032 [Serpula lacrymans var. lacrymans S7.3]|uniref:Zn(2)-C6 fungal-type domain-containing protein n=2 Tax=Serpula lacrymans var. lacrymans TaxID=341189 RepID=F8PQA9_SERL3|nr:uncharacterized protein SERLADRAFT_462199 [Serpula lacrymans var. lacrymans S7.9]EGO02210.1 hypothetical protein SERLA73DRAFT_178032 [Serpula lacrymans var. lacrymans S7.3]EGO27926.1 hypothetical protein SERLADRAFT_462199 [Serpula lacrymans var. lacrymans S7.9]